MARPAPLPSLSVIVAHAIEQVARAHALTPRQRDVLLLVCQGHSNASIAAQLDIVENTVEVHVSALLRKLRCTSRTELLLAVLTEGLGEP